jgi:hypothetical protein
MTNILSLLFNQLLPLFGTTPQDVVEDTPEQVDISKYLRGAWAAFAKDPEQGLLSYEGGWPQYSTNQDTLVRLAYNNQTGTNLARGNMYDEDCQPPAPDVTSPAPGGGVTDIPGAAIAPEAPLLRTLGGSAAVAMIVFGLAGM